MAIWDTRCCTSSLTSDIVLLGVLAYDIITNGSGFPLTLLPKASMLPYLETFGNSVVLYSSNRRGLRDFCFLSKLFPGFVGYFGSST